LGEQLFAGDGLGQRTQQVHSGLQRVEPRIAIAAVFQVRFKDFARFGVASIEEFRRLPPQLFAI